MARRDYDPSLIGFHGLALLRGWPYASPDVIEGHLDAIRAVLDGEPEGPGLERLSVEDAYSEWAATYDDAPNSLLDAEETAVRSAIEAVPVGDLAVDVACGTGRITAVLARSWPRVIGVDPSDAMLEVARGKDLRASFGRGAFDAIPVADAAADLVTCALALTHALDLDSAIAELSRIARPGGAIVLSDIHPVAVATGAHAFFRAPDGRQRVARNHVHWPSAYLRAFAANGLEVVSFDEPPFTEFSLEVVTNEVLRSALADAVVGLPFAIVWSVRRRN